MNDSPEMKEFEEIKKDFDALGLKGVSQQYQDTVFEWFKSKMTKLFIPKSVLRKFAEEEKKIITPSFDEWEIGYNIAIADLKRLLDQL